MAPGVLFRVMSGSRIYLKIPAVHIVSFQHHLTLIGQLSLETNKQTEKNQESSLEVENV